MREPTKDDLARWAGWPQDPLARHWQCRACAWNAVEGCPEHEPVQRAAVQYAGQTFDVARPYRHDAAIRLAHFRLGDAAFEAARREAEQGFMAWHRGKIVFARRQAAFAIAARAGQVDRGKLLGPILTSEDLW